MIGLIFGDTDLPKQILKKVKKNKVKYFIIDLSGDKSFKNDPQSQSIAIGQFGKIFEIFNDFPDLVLEHHFLDDGHQTIHIKGLIAAEELNLLAYKYIEGLQELGISKPIWPSNAFGALIFIVTHMIFDEAEYARSD